MKRESIVAAAVTGLATGPRSFTGLAAVVMTTPPDAHTQPDRILAHPAAKTAVGLLALQEWVMDKLPQTPSRLEALGLFTRALGAGSAGAIIARRAQVADAVGVTPVQATLDKADQPPTPSPDWTAMATCAGIAAATALGVAAVGVQLRAGFEHLFGGRDWPAAALEDLSSAALAGAAVYVATTA